jgi:hypothetical protein
MSKIDPEFEGMIIDGKNAFAHWLEEKWLKSKGNHPLKDLWRSKANFVRYELATIGLAFKSLTGLPHRNALVDIRKRLKTKDTRKQAGAIVELIGAYFFNNSKQTVILPPPNTAGYEVVS